MGRSSLARTDVGRDPSAIVWVACPYQQPTFTPGSRRGKATGGLGDARTRDPTPVLSLTISTLTTQLTGIQ